jgi:hypothetical protein
MSSECEDRGMSSECEPWSLWSFWSIQILLGRDIAFSRGQKMLYIAGHVTALPAMHCNPVHFHLRDCIALTASHWISKQFQFQRSPKAIFPRKDASIQVHIDAKWRGTDAALTRTDSAAITSSWDLSVVLTFRLTVSCNSAQHMEVPIWNNVILIRRSGWEVGARLKNGHFWDGRALGNSTRSSIMFHEFKHGQIKAI